MTAPSKVNGITQEKLHRSCSDKNRYTDSLTASAAGAHYMSCGQEPNSMLWWYRCPHCAGYHLTRRNCGTKQNVMFLLDSKP